MYYPKSQMNEVYNFLLFHVNGGGILSVESDTNESLSRSHETNN